MHKELLQVIKERRSVREFTVDKISTIDLMSILEGGSWAPSVNNRQPWRFIIIEDDSLRSIVAELTVYSTVVAQSPVLVAVLLEKSKQKPCAEQDHQSVGAVVQNMLLTAESLGLGGVWLGEIANNKEQVHTELAIPEKYELAAMVAIGYPAHRNQKSHRKDVHDFILKHIGG